MAQQSNNNEPDVPPVPTEDEVDALSEQVANISMQPGLDVKAIGQGLKVGKYRNIIIMCGAGISVSAGIPDFRSPGTGLYDNLQKYNLPRAEAIFDIDFFQEHPKAFCTLAKELYPGGYRPTSAHFFMKLLDDKKVLRRCFTQNIDGLELLAGLDPSRLVQAHGGFQQAHCIKCHQEYSAAFVKDIIFQDQVPRCTKCNGLVKPDIVFFGEDLPPRFHKLAKADFKHCDLLIVMGTSLTVNPFASLIDQVPAKCPRLLINLQEAGVGNPIVPPHITAYLRKLQASRDPQDQWMLRSFLLQTGVTSLEQLLGGGFRFDDPQKPDVFLKSTTDSGCSLLSELAGWSQELAAIDEACTIPQQISKKRTSNSKEADTTSDTSG